MKQYPLTEKFPLFFLCIVKNHKPKNLRKIRGFKVFFRGCKMNAREVLISGKVSKIDNYFKEIYERCNGLASELSRRPKSNSTNPIRVDSTIVADTCAKLKEERPEKWEETGEFSFHLMEFCLQVS